MNEQWGCVYIQEIYLDYFYRCVKDTVVRSVLESTIIKDYIAGHTDELRADQLFEIECDDYTSDEIYFFKEELERLEIPYDIDYNDEEQSFRPDEECTHKCIPHNVVVALHTLMQYVDNPEILAAEVIKINNSYKAPTKLITLVPFDIKTRIVAMKLLGE